MRKRSCGFNVPMAWATPSPRAAILPPAMLPETSSTKVQSEPSAMRESEAAGVITAMKVPGDFSESRKGTSSTRAGMVSSRR